MSRPAVRPRTALLAVVAAAALLGGCASRDASQAGVRDKVRQVLVNRGIPTETAAAVGDCVGRDMFESSDRYTKDERNAAWRALDGDPADPDLEAKITETVSTCEQQNGVDCPSEGDEGVTTATLANGDSVIECTVSEATTSTTGG